MDHGDEGPPNKKSKTDDTRCCKCNCFLRKGKSSHKVNTKEEAEQFYKSYNFYIQSNESLCNKCYTQLRCAKSKSKPKQEVYDSPSVALVQEETSTAQTPIVDEGLSQALSDVSIDQDEEKPVDTQASQDSTPTFQPSYHDSASSKQQSSNYSTYYPSDESDSEDKEYVNMPFERVASSKARCFICAQIYDIVDVPIEARLQVFTKKQLFIPKRNRCCPEHLIKKRFYENQLSMMTAYSNETELDATELRIFIERLSSEVDVQLHGKIGDFSISEERVKSFTGYSWTSIIMLQDKLSSMRKSDNRNVTQALVVFLFKLRSGNSNSMIAAILDLTEKVVETSIKSILKCFKECVLPQNFGVASSSREFVLQQQAEAVKLLYGREEKLFLICDGTYLRHEKSSNNAYQRKSFSGQKKVHLCKPFTICTTNGYIVDVAGPFEGTMNDAKILRHIMQDQNGLVRIFKKGDVFILDRGSCDVVSYLEEKGFKALMPALKGKRKQLTAQKSNDSRFVTKLRWVMEAIHGLIAQKNKLLHHQFSNKALPDAETYCKTACYIQNVTGKRLNSDNGDKLRLIIERMKTRKDVANSLAVQVSDANYDKKSVPFEKITSSDLLDFPELSLEDLELIFTGSYQLKQAISYLGEMLDENNVLPIDYLKEDSNIVRFAVRSRHINSRTYKCYIHYDPDNAGIDAIRRYCCNCANGLRTVGCCSHVAALIYHLSYGRFLSKVIRPAEMLRHLFAVDNICPTIDEDSDED